MSEILKRSGSLRQTENQNDERKILSFVMVSSDNGCKRYDYKSGKSYTEILDINGANVSSLKTMFKDHEPSVDTAIAKIENIRIENNELICDCVFSDDEASKRVYQKYIDGILSDVSIGYRIDKQTKRKREDGSDEVIVNNFTVFELSAVWLGADKGAKKRTADEKTALHNIRLKELNLKQKGLAI